MTNTFAVSPDGNYIVAGGDSGTPWLWNLGTAQIVQTFAGTNS
jgi:WD40 repeat protein